MINIKKQILAILSFILLVFPCYALEDLDELDGVRADRKSVNTFFSGETVGNGYLWQPQTTQYIDTTSDYEIWILSSTDNVTVYGGNREFGGGSWSADGKRFAMAIDRDTDAFVRGSYTNDEIWLTMRSDGTYLRPAINGPSRICTHSVYFNWSPVQPDIYYQFGRNYSSEGLSSGHLYKATVSDSTISIEDWITFAGSERDTPKMSITADGKYLFATSFVESTQYTVGNLIDQNLKITDADIDLGGLDSSWGNTPATFTQWHDEYFTGNAARGYWIYFMPAASNCWWRMRPWGTDGNAPTETTDTTSSGAPNYYDWWGDSGWTSGTEVPDNASEEVQPLNGLTGTHPVFTDNYWSHMVASRWGDYIAYSDTEDAYVAPAVWNVDDSDKTAFPASVKGSQYHSWVGWTDYTAGTDGADYIYRMKYNDGTSHAEIASIHATTGTEFTKPAQSPDGTKTAYRSDFLQPTSTNGDLFYVVSYFPYPPEITACTATGDTVTTTFEWMLDSTPRGYTTRGWPDEDDDDPCPPRETEKFRLWRSSDKSTWTPLTTTNAEIFTRYDFSDGTWDGNDYWTITDVPGDGTWYYAVTSVEWSGLGSRALSNIFAITVSSGSGTGSEDTVYPASPGDLDNISTSDFYTSYNSSNTTLIRYYNIYAEDGSSPSISQTNRVASISKNVCSDGDCSWVDWLGKTDGTTEYVITVVDTQGNESTGISVTATHKKDPATADGQYTLEWDDVGGSNSSISIPGSLTITLGGSQTLSFE